MTHHTPDYAKGRIRKQGFRLTPQREIVLQVIGEGNGHTPFDGIQKRVEAKAPAINHLTIYRTLEFLQQMVSENAIAMSRKDLNRKRTLHVMILSCRFR